MNLEKMGKYIATNRKKRGMTQQELGDSLGVSAKTISKWERGINAPDISFLPALARKLNTSIENIIAGEDSIANATKENNRVLEKLKLYKDKIKREMLIIVLAILALSIFISGVNLLHDKLYRYTIYEMSSSNVSFTIEGRIVFNCHKKILSINGLSYDASKSIKTKKIKLTLLLREDALYEKTYISSDEEETDLDDLLKLVKLDINSQDVPKLKKVDKQSLKELKLQIAYDDLENENILIANLFE